MFDLSNILVNWFKSLKNFGLIKRYFYTNKSGTGQGWDFRDDLQTGMGIPISPHPKFGPGMGKWFIFWNGKSQTRPVAIPMKPAQDKNTE